MSGCIIGNWEKGCIMPIIGIENGGAIIKGAIPRDCEMSAALFEGSSLMFGSDRKRKAKSA